MPIPSRPLLLVGLAAGFAVAHTQSPLFFSNQNQYLLHGLAEAGYGHLDRDWLANTKDPTPVFSAGVAAAYQVGGLWPIQVAFFVLLMGYFLAVWWLAEGLLARSASERTGTNPRSRFGLTQLLAFAALLTAAHAALPRLASVWLTGVDYPWYLQAGVAGQYVLGPGLQPSAFGVLLIASVAAFANDRPLLAAGLGSAAVVMHATYLLPAALFTLGYIAVFRGTDRSRPAAGVAVVALAVAAPAVAYTALTFRPSGAKGFEAAQYVLAEVRIPHHTNINKWFDWVAGLQVAWMVVGIVLLRKSRLFVPLLVAAGGGLLLTLFQLVVMAAHGEMYTLVLLFPWRVSVVLVPVATAAVAATTAGRLPATRGVAAASAVLFALLVAGGVVITADGLGYRMNEAEVPLLEWVRGHAGPDDVYLIPAQIPKLKKDVKGSRSNSFTPPPRPDSNLIPVDLQRFRLATGTPIYVDFKSVPYLDVEVLEWYRRVLQVEEWYGRKDWDAAGVRKLLAKEGITHVVVPRQQPIRAGFLEPVYEDRAYTVYRVHSGR